MTHGSLASRAFLELGILSCVVMTACGKNQRQGACVMTNAPAQPPQWHDASYLQASGGYIVSEFVPSYRTLFTKPLSEITPQKKTCSARFEFYKEGNKRKVDVWTNVRCIDPLGTVKLNAEVYLPKGTIKGVSFERGFESIELVLSDLMLRSEDKGGLSRSRRFIDASKDLPAGVRRELFPYFNSADPTRQVEAALDPVDVSSRCTEDDNDGQTAQAKCQNFLRSKVHTFEVSAASLTPQAADALDALEELDKRRRAEEMNLDASVPELMQQWKKSLQELDAAGFDANKAGFLRELAKCGTGNASATEQPATGMSLSETSAMGTLPQVAAQNSGAATTAAAPESELCQNKDKVIALARQFYTVGGKEIFASQAEAKQAGIAEADFPAELERRYKAKIKENYSLWKKVIAAIMAQKAPVSVQANYYSGQETLPEKVSYLTINHPSALKAHAGFLLRFEKDNVLFGVDKSKSLNFSECYHLGSYLTVGKSYPFAAFGLSCAESGSTAALRLPTRMPTTGRTSSGQPELSAEAKRSGNGPVADVQVPPGSSSSNSGTTPPQQGSAPKANEAVPGVNAPGGTTSQTGNPSSAPAARAPGQGAPADAPQSQPGGQERSQQPNPSSPGQMRQEDAVSKGEVKC